MMILDLERNGSRYLIGSSAFATGACLRPPTALLSTSTADSSASPSRRHRPSLTPKQDRHRPAVTTRDRSRITGRFASDSGNSPAHPARWRSTKVRCRNRRYRPRCGVRPPGVVRWRRPLATPCSGGRGRSGRPSPHPMMIRSSAACTTSSVRGLGNSATTGTPIPSRNSPPLGRPARMGMRHHSSEVSLP
jgi:hypothetical protein